MLSVKPAVIGQYQMFRQSPDNELLRLFLVCSLTKIIGDAGSLKAWSHVGISLYVSCAHCNVVCQWPKHEVPIASV